MRAWQRLSGKTRSRRQASRPDAALAEGRARAVHAFDAWRDAAYDVEAASRRWRSAPADDMEAAAWTFSAALEREEKAARDYERACRAWSPPPKLASVGR